MSENIYTISEEFINEFYKKLESFHMELDSNPLEYSPQRLNEKISLVTNYQSDCNELYTKISQKHLLLNKIFMAKKINYELAYNDLLANDQQVKAQKSMKDRKALAQYKLEADYRELTEIENAIREYESLTFILNRKMLLIKEIQGKIKEQIKISQMDIDVTGTGWKFRDKNKIDITRRPGIINSSDNLASLLKSLDDVMIQAKEEEEAIESKEFMENDKPNGKVEKEIKNFFDMKIG